MRASDRDRAQAVAVLRKRCAEGYMSVDTFERRVEQTSRPARWRSCAASSQTSRQGRSWLPRFTRGPGPARYAIPVALPEERPIVIGRSRRCDVVIEHPTVSRRHLELRLAGPEEWLADELWLGSCPVRLA